MQLVQLLMDPVQLFKAIDANGDGVISREEFMQFHAQMRPPQGPPPDGPCDRRPPAFRGEPCPPDRPQGACPGKEMRGPDGPDGRAFGRGPDGPQGPPQRMERGPGGPPRPPVDGERPAGPPPPPPPDNIR